MNCCLCNGPVGNGFFLPPGKSKSSYATLSNLMGRKLDMLCITCWEKKNPHVSKCARLRKHLTEDNVGFVVLIDFVPQDALQKMANKTHGSIYHSVETDPQSWWIVLKRDDVAYGEASPITIATIDLVDFVQALREFAPWLTRTDTGKFDYTRPDSGRVYISKPGKPSFCELADEINQCLQRGKTDSFFPFMKRNLACTTNN
jgi:hypothetical protein